MTRRNHDREGGFTLIELAVVVALIGILVAIAVPTFIRQAEGAENIATQALVRNAFNAERVYHLDHGQFTQTTSELRALEPSLFWNQATNPPGSVRVTIDVARIEDEVCIYSQSASGAWYGIYHHMNTGTIYGQPDQLRGCSASIVATNWTTGW